MRHSCFLLLFALITSVNNAQWVSGGIFATTNHFQAAAFQSPDTGIYVYGTDNPASGEGGIIATFNGNTSGGFYMWYRSPLILEDVDMRWSDGFPYYMAAGSKQYSTSVIVKPDHQFINPLQFDSVNTRSGQYYRAVRMRSDLVAFAAGGNSLGHGVIDMSVDTGATWTSVALLPGQPVSRLHFVNDQLAFASTGGYRRTNNNGVMLPDSGAIYRSVDGGLNWQQVFADPFFGYSDVAFSSTTNGVATRNDGVIMHTTDGGTNWAPANSVLMEAMVLTSVTFRPDGIGFATSYRTDGSAGHIWISSDGGVNWSLNYSTALLNNSRRIYDIYFYNDARGHASTQIKPLKTNSIITDIKERSDEAFMIYPNPASDQVSVTLNNAGPATIELTDPLGRVLWRVRTNDLIVLIPMQQFAPGHYFVRLRGANGVVSRSLIRQ